MHAYAAIIDQDGLQVDPFQRQCGKGASLLKIPADLHILRELCNCLQNKSPQEWLAKSSAASEKGAELMSLASWTLHVPHQCTHGDPQLALTRTDLLAVADDGRATANAIQATGHPNQL